jgi:biopolymer transport protein ExbB
MSIQSIAELLDAGGPVMWLIAIDCLFLWALLSERLLTLYGTSMQGDRRLDPLHALLDEQRQGLHHEDLVTKTERLVMAEKLELTRHFALIRCLIAIAPLLGLLGTVSGMIMTFDGILVGRRMEAASVGIAEALLTTQFGLAVVVPALIAERLLTRRSVRLAELRALDSAAIRQNSLGQSTPCDAAKGSAA